MKGILVRFPTLLAVLSIVAVLSAPGWGQVPGTSIRPILQTTTTITGQPIVYPLFRNQVAAILDEIASGGEDGRHQYRAFPYKNGGEVWPGFLRVYSPLLSEH